MATGSRSASIKYFNMVSKVLCILHHGMKIEETNTLSYLQSMSSPQSIMKQLLLLMLSLYGFPCQHGISEPSRLHYYSAATFDSLPVDLIPLFLHSSSLLHQFSRCKRHECLEHIN